MRTSRLAEWVAGGVAGCPGTVDTRSLDDPPPPTSAPQGGAVSGVGSRPRSNVDVAADG